MRKEWCSVYPHSEQTEYVHESDHHPASAGHSRTSISVYALISPYQMYYYEHILTHIL